MADSLPSLSISDVTVTEGQTASFTVTLSQASNQIVTTGYTFIDRIVDFKPREDKLVLERDTFTKLKRVSFATVKNVAEAKKSDALITYIRRTGALFYNQNGAKAGFGQGGQFADLQNGLVLGKADFSIVN